MAKNEDAGPDRAGAPGAAEKARQQVRLWIQQGDEACLKRQFIYGLRYYHKALALAQSHQLRALSARLCRDLAYVYVHHDAPEMALELIDRGLDEAAGDIELTLGLLVNESTAYLVLKNYPRALQSMQTALRSFRERFPDSAGAPGSLVGAHAALVSMERSVKRVVDLIEAGVDPERIEVSVELARPFWMPARTQ